MRRTYDLPVNPTERTGQLISLTELMRAVFIGNAESRDEYMDALIGMLDMSLRDLHSMLEGHEIPGVSA